MILYLISTVAFAQPFADKWSYRGYLEGRAGWSNSDNAQGWSTERVRTDIKYKATRSIGFQATINAEWHQGRYLEGELHRLLKSAYEKSATAGFGAELIPFEQVVIDCDWELSAKRNIDDISDIVTLPRLYVDINSRLMDVRIGRQAINWGSAIHFNPTDVFAQNLFAEPWQERQGNNAVRINADINDNGWLTALATVNDDFEEASGGLKVGFSQHQTDYSGIAALNDDLLILGADIKGDQTIGWWIEAAQIIPIADTGDSRHLSASIGIDYTVDAADGLYLMGQVSHDGSGEIPELYDWSARRDPAIQVNDCEEHSISVPQTSADYRQTLGRWYGLTRLGIAFADNWRIDLTSVLNLADRSGLLFPTIQFSGNRISMTTGVNAAFGSRGEFKPPDSVNQATGFDLNTIYPSFQALTWIRWNL